MGGQVLSTFSQSIKLLVKCLTRRVSTGSSKKKNVFFSYGTLNEIGTCATEKFKFPIMGKKEKIFWDSENPTEFGRVLEVIKKAGCP